MLLLVQRRHAVLARLPEPIALEQAMYDRDHRLPVNLVMAGDQLSNEPQVAAVFNTLSARGYLA